MTVVNTKSDVVSNMDNAYVNGKPNILNSVLVDGGRKKSKVGFCALAASESNNSTYRFARISSSDRISSLRLAAADAISGLTACDFGLYDIAANGGAVVSQHLFATGYDPHAGVTTPVELRYLNLLANTAEQAVWQLLGLSIDPMKAYDITMTATTRGSNTGNVAVEVDYLSPAS